MDRSIDARMSDWFEGALGEGVGLLCHAAMMLGLLVVSVPLLVIGAALDEVFLPGDWL